MRKCFFSGSELIQASDSIVLNSYGQMFDTFVVFLCSC